MITMTDFSASPQTKIKPIAMDKVTLHGSVLADRRETNHENSLPHQYEECERTGRIDNFRIASGRMEGEISPHLAADSDVYKWIEGLSYDLVDHPQSELAEKLDHLIELISESQESDGYLDTTFLFEKEGERWADLDHGHELYCGGHLIQAALAHKRVTGDERLFEVARRWADLICKKFGPEGESGTAGHPEVEMALVELFRETGKEKYLNLARFFLEERGQTPPALDGSKYIQDHLPIRKQTYMAGHAVRQLYLSSGMADLYAEDGDEQLFETLLSQWDDFARRKMAITGGAGSRYQGESFGAPYEIPNRTGYYETCASIASFMWNWRMLSLTGEARYGDLMERTLYNGLLSGVSLDGLRYFYTNPLEHDGGEEIGRDHRGSNQRTSKHWDHTACCPPNMARLLGSLPGYLYGKVEEGEEKGLYVHHYAASSVEVEMDGLEFRLIQETDYPWEGQIRLRMEELCFEGENPPQFSLHLRIPSWAEEAKISMGDRHWEEGKPGEYCEISRSWAEGDTIELLLPMPIRRLGAHPRVTNDEGLVALGRGPLLYCIEEVDQEDVDLFSLALDAEKPIETSFQEELLGGTIVLEAKGVGRKGENRLYEEKGKKTEAERPAELRAIPYHLWANRKPGAMRLWLPQA